MTIRYSATMAPFFAALLFGSCGISDADRCPAGFTYDTTVKACKAVPDAALTDPDTTGAPVDAGGGEAVVTPTFGTTCATTGECPSDTTNYCVVLPGTTSGYCSKAQCTTECPSDYRCCNCPAIGLVVCLKSSDASLATSAYGCTCS